MTLENRYLAYIRYSKYLIFRLLIALFASFLGGVVAFLICLVVFGLIFQVEIANSILPTHVRRQGLLFVLVFVLGWLMLKIIINETQVPASCLGSTRPDVPFRFLYYFFDFIGTSILFWELYVSQMCLTPKTFGKI